MQTLDPFTLPLNCSCLIEASAGTGKSYTIINLYLRLLLGVGIEPLSIEQILVVTFTKNATQELRDRVRLKLKEVYECFSNANQAADIHDPFLASLYQAVENQLPLALLRLKIAEQDIDLASIFTIHSFCQRMLFQFAFDSGIRFHIDLQPDEKELLAKISEEVWRERFYPMSIEEVEIVAEKLINPQNVLTMIKPFLSGILPPLTAQQEQRMNNPLAESLAQKRQLIHEVKSYWRANQQEIMAIIEAELAKDYPKGAKKSIYRRSLNSSLLKKNQQAVNDWLASESLALPEKLSHFGQQYLNGRAEEGATPLQSVHFEQIDDFFTAYQQFDDRSLLAYQFLIAMREKLTAYKATHNEKGFNDMLTLLHQALHGEQGEALAHNIRQQFGFAMIDEFQDTDQEQYQIFRQIFMPEGLQNQGFIMIGDPKQSIYAFRGADIFTYLEAAQKASLQKTLDKNWRSLPALVQATNQLFEFPLNANPFIYANIGFQAVKFNEKNDEQLIGEENNRYYLQDLEKFNEQHAAEITAYQIQQSLKAAEVGKLSLQKNAEIRPLAAADIAILVRSKDQALLVKEALQKRHIQSVFLSDNRSVFKSNEAIDLGYLLRACLQPENPTTLLAALACPLWHKTAVELQQLKQNEARWDYWVERFSYYRKMWQNQGVLPMIQHILQQEGLIQKLRACANAERRITDLLHLAELLQKQSFNAENEMALLTWFEQQCLNPDGQDDQRLRLESEQKLVRIITIHGSKGLEYPVVWLPFIGKPYYINNAQTGLDHYRTQDNQLLWQFGSPNETVKQALIQNELSEDLRLLYVAMTRPRYQLNAILPKYFHKGWNAMLYLLSNGEIGCNLKAESQISTEEYLENKQINAKIITIDQLPEDDWKPKMEAPEALQAAEFHRKIRVEGMITSFTALYAQHEWLTQKQPFNEGQDYDAMPNELYSPLEEALEPHSPYLFPHGSRAGNALHHFFEHCSFDKKIESQAVKQLCSALNLDESWLEPTSQWLTHVLQTPMNADECCFSLSTIDPQKRLNEWEFYLRLSNPKALPQLNQLMKKHSSIASQLPDLRLAQLQGFIKGFIDCIVQVEGKFYILDYKSNLLGYTAADYQAPQLIQAVGQHRYDLQYLLYTLALHRYLRFLLADNYDYERDFGGCFYLFIRAMDGTPQQGVYFDRPNWTLIDELDRLFA